jgi:hypothetical protein
VRNYFDLEWRLVTTSPSDYKANDNGYKCNSKGKGEDNAVKGDKRVVFRDLEVKGHVVKEWLND